MRVCGCADRRNAWRERARSPQAENIDSVIKASNNKVEAYWSALYAGLLSTHKLDDIIMKPGA